MTDPNRRTRHQVFPAGFRWPPGLAAVACVDVGGTKVATQVVDEGGVLASLTEPTAKVGHHGVLAEQVRRMIERACVQAGKSPGSLAAVGVSSCGPFVLRDGLVELAAPNICGGLAGQARGLPNDWTTALLEAPLREAFVNVRVANDAIAALEAERRWGALQVNGQPLANCAYVTWSTGIGFGVCVDGHVLHGKHGNAGHAGHTFVSDGDPALCGCGNTGDVEGLVAGNALPRRFGSMGYPDAAALLSAAEAGDAAATAIVDELCRVMGRALYNLVVTLDLERISIGGGVFWHHQDFLLPRLRAQIGGRLPALTQDFELWPAGLGEQVGDFGALALAL